MWRALLAVALVCAWSSADAGAPAPPAKPDLLAQAELLLETAQATQDATERFRLADEAAALCERAATAKPTDPEPILRLIRALTVSEPDHPEACRKGRCEAALAQLVRLREIDPLSLEAARIAAEEGILLSRLGRFEEAMLAYERALPLIEPQRRPNGLDERLGSVLLWGNSAETAMALGQMEDAIRRYEVALEHATYGEVEWQLALYGLGVALDRDGQVDRARSTIQRVLERDPSLSRLHDDGVFFAPPGDLHYYEGLGHEIAGDNARARAAFLAYLQAQPHARWAARVKTHLATLARRAPAETVVGQSGVAIGRPLSEHQRRGSEAVRQRVQAHDAELRVCYERLLRTKPAQPVGLQLAIEISAGGFIGARARVLTTTEPALELSRCVELAAEGWRFQPLVGGESEMVLIPIDFTPAQVLRRRR